MQLKVQPHLKQRALSEFSIKKTANIQTSVGNIQNFTKDFINIKDLSTKELLLYQVQANKMFLKVELTSKVAECVSSIFKKLQNF